MSNYLFDNNVQINGNVGIGTNNPHSCLQVGSNNSPQFIQVGANNYVNTWISAGNSTTPHIFTGSDHSLKMAATPDTATFGFGWEYSPSTGDYTLMRKENSTSFDPVLTVKRHNGNVGIGNSNPLAKLTLSNLPYGGTFTAGHGWYNFNHGGVMGIHTNSGGTAAGYGIGLYITDHGGKALIPELIVGHGISYSSDRRIKTNIIELEDNEALNIFRQLKPCKYNYIDYRGRGTDKVFGFIAQEVKEILPYAVISSKTIGKKIPNIYTFADVNNITLTFHDSVDSYTDDNGNIFSDLIGNTSLFTKDSENNFDTLIFYSSNGTECRREIVNIIDEKTFEIDNPIESEYIEDNKIFVFGQEASDFHTLNKDAIWTTAAAALQEVDRIQQNNIDEIQQLKQKNIELETKNTELENKCNNLEEKNNLLENQLQDILARLSNLENN